MVNKATAVLFLISLIFAGFSGCGRTEPSAPENEQNGAEEERFSSFRDDNPGIPLDGEKKEQLLREMQSPLLTQLFEDTRFRVYMVEERKRDYDRITVDFYKSQGFGLFTEHGKKRAAEFMEEYGEYIDKAAERFNLTGDLKPVITALSGIESKWGDWIPRHRAFNSLYSVYQQLGSHRRFALRNIEGLLDGLKNPAIEIDPFMPSSFMGAVGYCQLMPFWFTEITRRSVEKQLDLSGDGVFNPYNMADSIAFFAWCLSENGYNRNARTAVRRYNGSGYAAEAFADAVMEFAKLIK